MPSSQLRRALTFPVLAVAFAGLIVVAHGGFGAGDLAAMFAWSLPSVPILYAALRLLDRSAATVGATVCYLLSGVLAVAVAALSIALVASILGPWIRTFSFPIRLIWFLSAWLPCLAAARARHRLRVGGVFQSLAGPAAAALSVLVFFSPKQPPDLVVVLKAGVTRRDLDEVDKTTLSPPPAADEYSYNPYNTRSHVLLHEGDRWSFRVFFHPGAERRDEFVAKIKASPHVAQVFSAPATPVEGMTRFRSVRFIEKRPPN